MFTLNEIQRARLAAARAWQEVGDRRFEFWSGREAQAATTTRFGRVLAESGLRAGRALSLETRHELLRLAARLAPNANLSRRLFAGNPADFDRRLRLLFSSQEPLEARLNGFLAARGTGMLTASGLLCAFDPDTYPFITRPALRRLALSLTQRREALEEAKVHYGFDLALDGKPSPAQELLALFVVYEAARELLRAATFPEVDALIRADLPLPTAIPASVVREAGASYAASPAPALTETRLLSAIEEFVAGQGFSYPPHLLRSYYVALKTRPFAILSGVSGTGKTRLAELFAEALTGHHPAQFRLIPVRPDWTDSMPLFGYQNVMANRYVSTPFLDIARVAGQPQNRDKTFFVCLDEMNLARVEHYLADFLSALESRAHRIPLHEDQPDLVLPPNLFLTGTVNVDETTHTFSRKVLDRANTFDFDDAPLLLTGMSSGTKGRTQIDEDLDAAPGERQRLFLQSRAGGVAQARSRLSQIDPGFAPRALQLLQAANDLLYPQRLHFAYRVRDDVLMFLANSFDAETGQGLLLPDLEENFQLALDLQIKQKVLPKVSGVFETLDLLLAQMAAWAERERLPRAQAKIERMRAHGAATGYVRFYE